MVIPAYRSRFLHRPGSRTIQRSSVDRFTLKSLDCNCLRILFRRVCLSPGRLPLQWRPWKVPAMAQVWVGAARPPIKVASDARSERCRRGFRHRRASRLSGGLAEVPRGPTCTACCQAIGMPSCIRIYMTRVAKASMHILLNEAFALIYMLSGL